MRRALVAILIVAAGCSGGDSAGLDVDDPWARPNPNVATNAAFFMTLKRFFCSQCMNFACPLNGVPDPVRTLFWARNPGVS